MKLAEPYPETADDFIARPDLRQAVKIWTIPDGKWVRVKRHEWGDAIKKYEDEIPF